MFFGQTPEEVAGVLKETKKDAIRKTAIITAVALTALLVVTDYYIIGTLSFIGVIASVYVATADI